LRETTERPEAVEAGTVAIVGTRRQDIVARTVELLENPEVYEHMSKAVNPYGDGKASGWASPED
jgi:UDP-N-acetylglucosamine 2-epimerase (non-hydrolysing)